jgi:hypothetical protein
MLSKNRYIYLALFLLFSATITLYFVYQNNKWYFEQKRGWNYSCPNCHLKFDDIHKLHMNAYKNEGIVPQKNSKGLKRLYQKGKLVLVKETELYKIKDLTHSHPYVLHTCKLFLDKLGYAYKESCQKADVAFEPFYISSLTRSKSDVCRLKNCNANAITESAHLLGKTLDIDYRFFSSKERIQLFVNVLESFKKEKKCYVKYERNGCLHITVN